MSEPIKSERSQQSDMDSIEELKLVQKSEMGTQTEINQRDYTPPSVLKDFSLESKFPEFLQHSHNITVLIFISLGVFFGSKYLVKGDDEEHSIRENGLTGFFFACAVIIIYGISYFPDTTMQRPHPAFWRFVNAFGMCWLMCVVFANFLSKQDLLKFLQTAVDPNLGDENFGEKSYAEQCDFYTPNHPEGNFVHFYNSIFDMYFVAHLMGWFFKMVALRDFWLCQAQSFFFELLELTFRTWLHNFKECWWDSILLDLVIANTGGMILGYIVIKVFKMQRYPFKKYQVMKNTKQFLLFIGLMTIENLLELSHFFNKYNLKIDESHNILARRIFIVGFLVIPAFQQAYLFITEKHLHRVGPSCWIAIGVTVFETNLFFKNYDPQDYLEPLPLGIKITWAIISVIFLAAFGYVIKKDLQKYFAKEKKQIQIKIANKNYKTQ